MLPTKKTQISNFETVLSTVDIENTRSTLFSYW